MITNIKDMPKSLTFVEGETNYLKLYDLKDQEYYPRTENYLASCHWRNEWFYSHWLVVVKTKHEIYYGFAWRGDSETIDRYQIKEIIFNDACELFPEAQEVLVLDETEF